MILIKNSNKALYGLLKMKAIIAIILIVFSSCKNDIDVINSLSDSLLHKPQVSIDSVTSYYSDSGLVRMKMQAPLILKYPNQTKPYTEFPNGIHVFYYDDKMNVTSEIKANWAKFYEKEQLWEAKGNVIGINNIKKETLHSEELFWDEKTERIYSEKYTRIVNEDGVFEGKYGFEADQNMDKWKLKGSKGQVKLED